MGDLKNRNISTYTVASILVQLFISMVLVLGQTGTYSTDPTAIATNQLGMAENQLDQFNVANENTDITVSHGIDPQYDPILGTINTGAQITNVFSMFGTAIIQMPFLSVMVLSSVGGIMGIFLMIIIALWQYQIIMNLLKFIFPNRLGKY